MSVRYCRDARPSTLAAPTVSVERVTSALAGAGISGQLNEA